MNTSGIGKLQTETIPVELQTGSTVRLLALDFFRGLTMFVLNDRSTTLYDRLQESGVPLLSAIGFQFEHHPWNGLHRPCPLHLERRYAGIPTNPEILRNRGEDCLFIYLVDQVRGAAFLAHIGKPFVYALIFWVGNAGLAYANALMTWSLLWLCQRMILIKI